MNGRLAKAIRGATRRPGRPDVEYDQPARGYQGRYRGGPGVTVFLTRGCDRYHVQRMKRAIQRAIRRGAGRG